VELTTLSGFHTGSLLFSPGLYIMAGHEIEIGKPACRVEAGFENHLNSSLPLDK